MVTQVLQNAWVAVDIAEGSNPNEIVSHGTCICSLLSARVLQSTNGIRQHHECVQCALDNGGFPLILSASHTLVGIIFNTIYYVGG